MASVHGAEQSDVIPLKFIRFNHPTRLSAFAFGPAKQY
jgi:hypothetical protein